MANKKFSDLTLSFNDHVGNLNEARLIFQRELGNFDKAVTDTLMELYRSPTKSTDLNKVRLSKPFDLSTSKDGPWLNFTSRTILPIDLLPPNYQRYKNHSLLLYFESVFDDELGYFVFQARLENKNTANDNIDEKVIEIIKKEINDIFKNYYALKRNTAIIYRHKMNNQLWDQIGELIELPVQIIIKAVDEIFPDDEYLKQDLEEAEKEKQTEEQELALSE